MARQYVDNAIATVAYSMRTAIHRTLKKSPGSIVFHRDMLLDVPLIVNLELLHAQRELAVDKALEKANERRIFHDYKPGDQVLKVTYDPAKLHPQFEGPYPITSVHTNGTVTIKLNNLTQQRITIRQIKPYRQ
jgi:hypothetical protein